jgi:hypothetical protein
MIALLDAVAARRLRALQCGMVCLTAGTTAALARVLRSGLEELTLPYARALIYAPVEEVLAPALRDSPTLSAFSLAGSLPWADVAAVTALLRAAAANPAMRSLSFANNPVPHGLPAQALRATFGALMAQLLASDGCALTAVDVSGCGLRDEGLAPLLAALAAAPSTSRLRTLRIGGNGLSDAAARAHLLPAARACVALRELDVGEDAPRGALAAARLVACRAAGS